VVYSWGAKEENTFVAFKKCSYLYKVKFFVTELFMTTLKLLYINTIMKDLLQQLDESTFILEFRFLVEIDKGKCS